MEKRQPEVPVTDPRDLKFRLLTPEAVSSLLSIPVGSLKDMRKKSSHGAGPAYVKIGRLVRYPVGSVRRFLRSLKGRGAQDIPSASRR